MLKRLRSERRLCASFPLVRAFTFISQLWYGAENCFIQEKIKERNWRRFGRAENALPTMTGKWRKGWRGSFTLLTFSQERLSLFFWSVHIRAETLFWLHPVTKVVSYLVKLLRLYQRRTRESGYFYFLFGSVFGTARRTGFNLLYTGRMRESGELFFVRWSDRCGSAIGCFYMMDDMRESMTEEKCLFIISSKSGVLCFFIRRRICQSGDLVLDFCLPCRAETFLLILGCNTHARSGELLYDSGWDEGMPLIFHDLHSKGYILVCAIYLSSLSKLSLKRKIRANTTTAFWWLREDVTEGLKFSLWRAFVCIVRSCAVYPLFE